MLAGAFHLLLAASVGAPGSGPVVLRGPQDVEAVFESRDGRVRWSAYRDVAAGREWRVEGPLFSLQTPDGRRTNLGDVGLEPGAVAARDDQVVLRATLADPPVEVEQVFSFCEDGRTLRIRNRLRATGNPVLIQRVGLLEIRVPGQALERIGPSHVSCPIVGDRMFVGVEHPSTLSQVDGDTLYIAQHSYTTVGRERVEVPSAVFGSASEADAAAGGNAVKRAFLRYLDTVRVKPRDMHVHYNNWWTMPVPFAEKDVLGNIADLRKGLYDTTGFFFDSYAMDMGWSDPHTVWQVDAKGYPDGFARIRDALEAMGSHPGLWVSPSSLYPPALDNAWLEQAGYEVSPGTAIGRFACLAKGGRYQRAFKKAVLQHARDARFGHVKFDGLAWPCTAENHGHHPGIESYQPIAEGLMDVFDALRRQNPDIALEPTCLGYYPSPWWLMHTPFVIGPFGDDCPRGVCPAPEWIEALTTGREVANLNGRDAFWMPTSALECFDIIIQCPGDAYNHFVMAVGRGHWFQSTYINPRFMDGEEWRFFADLMRWARANRERLQDPVIFGGDPAQRQAYGYAYPGRESLFFIRNPWIGMATIPLPDRPGDGPCELRMLYPRAQVLCRVGNGEALPAMDLGPYELAVLEAVPTMRAPRALAPRAAEPASWQASRAPAYERLVYESERPAYGPSWTSPDGDADQVLVWTGSGQLRCAAKSELCILVEGPPGGSPARCSAAVDGGNVPLRETGTRGSFAATGAQQKDEWQWFLAPVSPGLHAVEFKVTVPEEGVRCGAFVRGVEPTYLAAEPFRSDRPFPTRDGAARPWSRTLAPVAGLDGALVPERRVKREIVTIDGLYLDTLDWLEATAGWGTVHRNLSVMGTPMAMGGRTFRRGIGTHAVSRIAYDLPSGYHTFAATIGCDQEVSANTVVLVVEGDGKELYRSPLMRQTSEPIDIELPIAGVKRLTLIVEDGGDTYMADHANWADARILR